MMSTPSQMKSKLEQKTLESSAHAALGLWGRIKRLWFRWAAFNQHAAWFPFLLGAVVGLDAMVVLLPGDVIVALAVLSNPLAWRRIMLASGLGSALGAFLLFLWISHTGGAHLGDLRQAKEALGMDASWEYGADFFRRWGPFSLTLGSLLPGLSWPPVVLAGLSQAQLLPVAFCLLLGRLARYLLLCYGVRYGWFFFRTLRAEAHREREKALVDPPPPSLS